MHEPEVGAFCPTMSTDEAMTLVRPASRLGMSPCEFHDAMDSDRRPGTGEDFGQISGADPEGAYRCPEC